MKYPASSPTDDKTIIGKIMLRFRPIAPKPPTGSSGTVDPPVDKICSPKKRGRPKRKYARTKKNNISSKIGDHLDPTAVMTLQLLPDVPKGALVSGGGSDESKSQPAQQESDNSEVLINFNCLQENLSTARFFRSESSYKSDDLDPRIMESSVMVESVTDVCATGCGLGNNDEDKIKKLELDTCPGFISDGRNVVRWINPAYRKMTHVSDGLKVNLVVKGKLPVEYPAFACRVRVEYATWRKEKGSCCQIVPCDVWRMDFGGLAWRLDLNAALSLGGHFMEI